MRTRIHQANKHPKSKCLVCTNICIRKNRKANLHKMRGNKNMKALTENKLKHVRVFGWAGSIEKTKERYPYEMFLRKDVLSAIELLKNKCFRHMIDGTMETKDNISTFDMHEIIDECFPIQQEEEKK